MIGEAWLQNPENDKARSQHEDRNAGEFPQ
jgi:hypothetical protein